MGYAQKLPYYIQPGDYLLLEAKAEFKHEYLDGVIYGWQGEGPLGMAGGSVRHGQVILNIALSLKVQLLGSVKCVFCARSALLQVTTTKIDPVRPAPRCLCARR